MAAKNISVILLLICIVSFLSFRHTSDCDPIDRTQLRNMLVQMGYTVSDLSKEPGKEKFAVNITSGGLNIPVAAEISNNSKFIWLTVFLTNADSLNVSKNYALLKENANTQPTHFYITKSGKLMLGVPIENKGVTNAYLREKLESLADNVVSKKAIWQ